MGSHPRELPRLTIVGASSWHRSQVLVPTSSALLVADGATEPLRRVVEILEPLAVDIAHSFRIAVVLVLPRIRLPYCISPRATIRDAVLSRSEVVALTRRPATQPTSSGPRGVFLRGERVRAVKVPIVEIRIAGPFGPGWTIVHVIMLVGVDGQVHIWPSVLEDVLETAPRCAVPTIFRPHERFGRLDVAEFSAVLEPSLLLTTVFSRSMSVLLVDFVESTRKMGKRRHGM